MKISVMNANEEMTLFDKANKFMERPSIIAIKNCFPNNLFALKSAETKVSSKISET